MRAVPQEKELPGGSHCCSHASVSQRAPKRCLPSRLNTPLPGTLFARSRRGVVYRRCSSQAKGLRRQGTISPWYSGSTQHAERPKVRVVLPCIAYSSNTSSPICCEHCEGDLESPLGPFGQAPGTR